MTSFLDTLTMLGTALDDGYITRDTAADLLLEAAAGGLTRRGALRTLDRHRQVRARFDDMARDVQALQDAFIAFRDALTPEEKATAGLRLEVEMELQRVDALQRMRRRTLGELDP